jgi:hypothetical protein
MEKYFPHCGKTGPFFPRNGKTVHTMEKLLPFFPHNGKSFRDFSTQWKKCFHSVENSVLGLFSGV